MTSAPDSAGFRGGGWATSWLVPVVIVAVAAAVIGGIIIVAQQEQGRGADALAATTVDADTLPVTVPYREVAGAIVIDVTLDEDGPTVPMLLDTGAPTIVSGAIAEAYAADPVGTVAATSPDGQVISSEVVRLPRIAIGGAVFRDVGAVVGEIEPGNPFYCLSDAGFVGASLMRTAAWQIDPVARTVTIAPSVDELDHIEGAAAFRFTPATPQSPSPLVEVPTGEGELTVVVDTGTDAWLAANPGDLEDVGVEPGPDAPTVEVLGSGAAGPFTTELRWAAAELDLGRGREFIPVAAADVLAAGRAFAGTDLLSRFVLTIDWPGETVYLDLVDPGAPLVPSVPASASLAWDDGFVVGTYVASLPGNEALALGAGVTHVDGEPVALAPFAAFCEHLVTREDEFSITLAEGSADTIPTAGELSSTVQVRPVEGFFDRLAD